MLIHPEISPFIPHTIPLSSPNNYQDFLRKSPKFLSHLNLNSILEYRIYITRPQIKEHQNLLKIFRSLKRIKKIHQNELVFHRIRFPSSKKKYIIKKVQRVQVLDLQDPLKISPARLDLWLKYGKSLKSINYQFSVQMFTFKKSMDLFEKQLHKSLKLLPRQKNLRAFKIRLAKSSSKALESLLQFQKYPPSIKNLAIYQQRAEDPVKLDVDLLKKTFSRLKSLEALTLSGGILHDTARTLLENIPSLLNIKKLNIQQSKVPAFGPMFTLHQCQNLQNLRHLKIGNIAESDNLSLLTNPPSQLENLDISAVIGINGFELISQFISLFKKSLKSLKVDIHYAYEAQTEEKMSTFFKKVSELEKLASFKFRVENTAPPFRIVNLFDGVMRNLIFGFFKQSIPLESFEWEVPGISSLGSLPPLIGPLQKSHGSLKKLKIFFQAPVELNKIQESLLFKDLRNLVSIEELYLTGFDIKEEGFWVDLVDCFVRMKSLRSLEVGYVTKGFQEKWFTKPLMKICQMKGLEILNVKSSFRPEVEKVVEKSLYLKEIMRVNPALREVSRNVRALFNTIGLEEQLF